MQPCQSERAISIIRVLALLVTLLLVCVSMPRWARADDPEGDAKLAKTRSIIEGNQQATLVATSSKPETSLADSAFQAGKGLAICLAILFIGAAVYKRLNPSVVSTRRAQRMQVLDRLSLGGRAAVLLVEIDGRQALIGVAADSVSIQPWSTSDHQSFENSMESECATTATP